MIPERIQILIGVFIWTAAGFIAGRFYEKMGKLY